MSLELKPVQLKQSPLPADEQSIKSAAHILFVLPATRPADLPFAEVLDAKLKRTQGKYSELVKSHVFAELPDGKVASWLVLDDKASAFKRHTQLRKALKPLFEEKPQALTMLVYGNESFRKKAAQDAFYVAAVNANALPNSKSDKNNKKTRHLKLIELHGFADPSGFADIQAIVAGNSLARQLSILPPNELTPAIYREKIVKMAKNSGWQYEEYDFKRLRKMGAGAFVAVAQGSDPQDAAIVHLQYAPKGAKKHISLVGKGICFDTGGHNLKPAKYMNGMHEDMNGSAVALGILHAATRAKLPIKIDCWLAIAQNHIGPLAYKQNDVVTALNGTTIEVVHTDAEGRMVLADTLTLASRTKPSFIMDFATLTGSMYVALGNRASGIIGNRPVFLSKAVEIGVEVGERVYALPFDEDYEEDLDSDIADIKQCTLEGGADHTLAARFLSRFIEGDIPWVHVDLSSYSCKGGLGAVATDTNGFGVHLAFRLIQERLGH
ncbi:MAG: leucyl aminopeptidase family protein [Methylophilaceae bacterium]